MIFMEKDPDDNRILECPAAANAYFIVSIQRYLTPISVNITPVISNQLPVVFKNTPSQGIISLLQFSPEPNIFISDRCLNLRFKNLFQYFRLNDIRIIS